MLVSELYEDVSHDDYLHTEVMNILMMFLKSGVPQTDVENIISELNKADITATEDDIKKVVDDNSNLSMNSEGQVVLSVSDDELGDERPDLEDAEEYSPVSDKAREATKKRMK